MKSAFKFFEKMYEGEEINDLQEDVMYEIESLNLPVDKYGFFKGKIKVQLEYVPEEENESSSKE
jgi:hypothetical protein